MDEYVDKVYEQFISEGGRTQRNILKEERAKLKEDAAASASRYLVATPRCPGYRGVATPRCPVPT